MSFSIYAGADRAKAEYWHALEHYLLMIGARKLSIPLNGGSDTRRDVREGWQFFAVVYGLDCVALGHMVEVYGPTVYPNALTKAFQQVEETRKACIANQPVKGQAGNPPTIHTNPPESGDN